MDPSTLFKGGMSADLKQLFTNCPFIFPFQTRELYFKTASFISSIDMHRSIYYLKQFLKQKNGSKHAQGSRDDLKKIAKQRVIVKRDSLLQSAF